MYLISQVRISGIIVNHYGTNYLEK